MLPGDCERIAWHDFHIEGKPGMCCHNTSAAFEQPGWPAVLSCVDTSGTAGVAGQLLPSRLAVHL